MIDLADKEVAVNKGTVTRKLGTAQNKASKLSVHACALGPLTTVPAIPDLEFVNGRSEVKYTVKNKKLNNYIV